MNHAQSLVASDFFNSLLGIVALVITDIDSVRGKPQAEAASQVAANENDPQAIDADVAGDDEEEEGDEEAEKPGTACMVHIPGAVTSNQTLRQWIPKIDSIADLISATDDQKTQAPAKDGDAHIRVVYQRPITVTWQDTTEERGGRTLEEAFALENLTWTQAPARQPLGLRIRKANELTLAEMAEKLHRRVKSSSFKKTDFALALLSMEPTDWVAPSYIVEGLTWLEGVVLPTADSSSDEPGDENQQLGGTG